MQPGRILSHYRLVEKVGEGGMGVVYRAYDTRLEREVALKVLPEGSITDDSARARFRKEALAMSKLNHPNIETVHDFNTQDGIDFLVMEYISGVTLDVRLAGRPLPEKEIVRFGLQLADGLTAAHEQHIVHRDLKPGNLMLTQDRRLKILDFGLAKLVRPTTASATTEILTQTHGVVGSLPYMPPEQLRGEAVDVRTDIYAAGTVLYEMATGRRPFVDTQAPRLIDAILNQEPEPPSTISRKISPRLETITLKALQKEPDDRYGTAKELRADLERLEISAPVARPAGRRHLARWWWAALVPIVLVAAILLAQRLPGLGVSSKPDSVAVLPFGSVNDDADAEYLSDGITENLINSLAELPAITKVIARASVFKYKGRDIDPQVVGRDLSVSALVTGNVVRRGDLLLITVALVDARDSRHIWGTQYRREFAEIFAVQDEIVGNITDNLQLKLSGEQRERLEKRDTDSPEAYRLYMKGRYYMNRITEEDLGKAQSYFRQALEEDPGYALAYAGIAESYYWLSNTFVNTEKAMPKAQAAALQALEIDETLGEAHALLGMVNSSFNRDWPTAEREFLRAIELNPNDANAHNWYGLSLVGRERFDEALAEMERGRELDPLSLPVSIYHALALYFAGEYEQAIESLQDTIEMDSDYFLGYAILGLVHEQTGDLESSIAAFERAIELDGPLEAVAQLAHAHVTAGNLAEAERLLERLERERREAALSSYNLAVLNVAFGRHDEAFRWLELALEEESEWLLFLTVDPRLEAIRSDPRYADLRRRAWPN
jgi:serine/threonine-protein kinase